MNVTVVVPKTLRFAVDGKRQLDLGVPNTAGVGDVPQTLFSLYPKLRQVVATERRAARQQVMVFLDERASRELAHGRPGLRSGDRLFLCGYVSEPAALTTGVQ